MLILRFLYIMMASTFLTSLLPGPISVRMHWWRTNLILAIATSQVHNDTYLVDSYLQPRIPASQL